MRRPTVPLLLLIFVALLTVLAGSAGPAAGATFEVNDLADRVDVAPGDGVCATRAGTSTLRAAVMEANAAGPGPHAIKLGRGVHRLTIPRSGVRSRWPTTEIAPSTRPSRSWAAARRHDHPADR